MTLNPLHPTFQLELRIDLMLPPPEVFEFVANRYFENLRRWRPELIEVTPLTPGPVGVGTQGVEVREQRRGRQRKQPYGRIFAVTQFQPFELFALEGTDSGGALGRYRSQFTFSPLGTRTRLWHHFAQELDNPIAQTVLALPFRFRVKRELRRQLLALRDAIDGK